MPSEVAPRKYAQGRRAETAGATRLRIVEATIDLYRERGVPATTLTAVAERADVSRGTIVNHFGGPDGLLGAVLDSVLDRLQLPDEHLLETIDDPDARMRAFVEAMVDLMERSAPWWSIFEGQMERPELQVREATYWEGLGRLQAAALGPALATDQIANGLVLSLIHPATIGTVVWSFERVGLGVAEARVAIADLALAYLQRRRDRLVSA